MFELKKKKKTVLSFHSLYLQPNMNDLKMKAVTLVFWKFLNVVKLKRQCVILKLDRKFLFLLIKCNHCNDIYIFLHFSFSIFFSGKSFSSGIEPSSWARFYTHNSKRDLFWHRIFNLYNVIVNILLNWILCLPLFNCVAILKYGSLKSKNCRYELKTYYN